MTTDRPKPLAQWPTQFVLLLLVLCASYAGYRSVHLAITNDEVELLKCIHERGYRDLVLTVDWNSQALAHFLDALLAKPCVKFLPVNEIVASRVPSLLGLLLFLWGVWRVGTLFPTGLTRALITLALVSNAFLLDFFGLSRGYGLALGFAMLSLSCLLQASLVPSEHDESARRQAARAVWLAFGSALSSMAFLYLYVAVLLATLWLPWRNRFKLSFGWCISTVLLGVFYLPRVLATLKHKGTFFGGDVGFFHDTVASLVRTMFYDLVAPAWLVGLLSIAVTLIICFLAYWTYREGINGAFILSAMTVLVAAFCITAHAVWKVAYPMERCALFFVPLVVLDFGVAAAWSRHRWLRLSLWGMLLVYTGVGLSGANLSHTQYCRADADIPSALLELRNIHKKTGQEIQIAFSDGAKWPTWYYAEHLLGLHLAPAYKEAGYAKTFEWLTVYEWRGCLPYLVNSPPDWLLPGTTHLLLDEDDTHLLAQFPVGNVAELRFYPASGMRLFALTKPEYRGTTRLDNGAIYQGWFKQAQANGMGTLTEPDGKRYVGEFKDGRPNGHGVSTFPDGTKYECEFKDGLPNGQGTLTRPNGQQYVGEFRDGTANGQGVATFPDGTRYAGEFKNALANGQGTLTFSDGRLFVGQFRDGNRDGIGKMTYPGGKVEEGLWKDDRFLGAAP